MSRHAGHRAAIKTLFRELVDELGGLSAAASCTRVGISVLQEYGSPNNADRFPPLDVVLDLEIRLGRPVVSSVLLQALGFEPMPVKVVAPMDPVKALQAVARDSGEMLAAAMAAHADGRLDRRERVELRGLLGRLAQDVRAATVAIEAADAAEAA